MASSVHQSLVNVLTQATSQNPALLKEAEARLSSWESERGFYRALAEIFTNSSVEMHLRWMAVLYFKNGVDRYWRKTAPNCIPEEEKTCIREYLLASLPEPVSQIAVQKAVVISKIARFDIPREWTALYPTLLNVVRDSSPANCLAKTRALEILALTTKTLASKRLAGDRRVFYEIASDIFLPVAQEWEGALNQYYATLGSEEALAHLERARYCLKTLRYISVHGFPSGSQHFQPLALFLDSIFNEARRFFASGPISDPNWEKFLVLLVKIPEDVLENKPFMFVRHISDALQFCWHFTCDLDPASVPTKLIVHSFNLMKAILLCMEYKMSKSAGASPHTLEWDIAQQGNEAMAIRSAFFSKSRVKSMTAKLIGSYFLLTQEDLQTWMHDPEGFARDDAGETSKYSLRACVECFFAALTHEYCESVCETIMEIYNEQSWYVPPDPDDLQAILVADAVYCAFGLAAFHLFDEIDFNQWLTDTLVRQLKISHPNYKILKHRIVWLIGRWIVVRLKSELRPLIYQEVLPFIGGTGCDDEESGESDLVLRLQAANTLKLAVDDFEFDVDQFLPFLESTFLRLFALLQEVQECDTKLKVLHVMSFVVERVGPHIKPFLSGLVDYLPRLWNEAVSHQMLKASIVATLVHIVESIGRDVGSLYSFLLAVVRASTDSSSPDHVYLLEDGLDLWLALLKNAPEPNDEIMAIYDNNMPGLLELGGENLKTSFKIIMAYMYLAPEVFVRRHGQALGEYFRRMATELKKDGILALVRLTELAVRALPYEAPLMMRPFVEWTLSHILAEAETCTAPMLTSAEFAVISRVILFLPDLFHEAVQSFAASVPQRLAAGDTTFEFLVPPSVHSLNVDPACVLGKLIDLWIARFATFVTPSKRKVMSAAFASLLPSGEGVVLDRFCGILLCVCEAMNDLCESEDLSGVMDCLALREDAAETPFAEYETQEWYHETPQDERKRDLTRKDPIYSLHLRDFVQSQINALKEKIGNDNFHVLLTSVDSETMRSAQDYFVL